MNQKKAKKLRQLVRHLMDSEKVSSETWLNYGQDQKFVTHKIPSEIIKGENGELKVEMKQQLVATGSRKMDPTCGRAIYQMMKGRAPTL